MRYFIIILIISVLALPAPSAGRSEKHIRLGKDIPVPVYKGSVWLMEIRDGKVVFELRKYGVKPDELTVEEKGTLKIDKLYSIYVKEILKNRVRIILIIESGPEKGGNS
jgi:hypothetical protein